MKCPYLNEEERFQIKHDTLLGNLLLVRLQAHKIKREIIKIFKSK